MNSYWRSWEASAWTWTAPASSGEFDDRFPMTQSLYNWSQDLENALGNAGIDDPAMLRARIAVCEEALHRFANEDQLMTENRRRALAESYFEIGQTGQAEHCLLYTSPSPRDGLLSRMP